MSGLCGWFTSERASVAHPELIATMSSSLKRFDDSTVRSLSAPFGSVAAAALHGECDVAQMGEQLVAICGHARFTDVALQTVAQREGIARALGQGFTTRHTDVLDSLTGSFVVAILDGRRSEALVAVDRVGTRPIYYSADADKLVFASALDAIGVYSGMTRAIDPQALYDYVYFHMVPGPQTINAGRHRLLPGHFVLWRNGGSEIRPYWKMQFEENSRRPLAELKASFLSVLREGVRSATGNGKVGAFLSGGTDSSTVAGMLGTVTGEPARTYSIGFDAEGYDEMEYARIAAQHFGTRHREYYVTPDDVVAAIPLIAAAHDQPFGNSSAVPTFYCAKLAKEDGVDTLLGGDGGDELFGGNVRYAKQYLYSLYSDLPTLLRKNLIEPIVFRAPSVSITGKVQRYIRNASEPMPARYDNYNLLERLGADNVFTAEFLRTIDTNKPRTQMAHAYDEASAETLINRMLAFDLRFTLADNDLPKVIRSCELAQVDVQFPLLDDAVVAFSASLAPKLKLKGTQLRYFFREALRGFLPDAIIKKKKHGFGLPFGPWLQTHKGLQQLVGDSLHDLKQRHIVRAEFIDELMSKRLAEHPAYYGTMPWILMMLEQWYQQHPVQASSRAASVA
jgi:asparagine synthase (glutamine-hydrolysing)